MAGVLASLVRLAAQPLSNFDTYFHLRFGAEFLDEWSLREPGSVSSFATAQWVPTQWLPQVVMAWTEDRIGLTGVAFLAGVQLCALALTFYWTARMWADPLPSSVLLVTGVIAMGPVISMRPQVLSFIMVALTTHSWLSAPTSARLPWLLVPLTWLWAMCHGMWPVGVAIGFAAVVGWSMDDWPGGSVFLRRLSVPVAAGLGAALTPVGPGLYRAVLAVGDRSEYFGEWQPADFAKPSNAVAAALLAVLGVLLVRRGSQGWLTTAMTLVAVGSALYSTRTVPVAIAMLVPLAASQIQPFIGARIPPGRKEVLTTATLLVGALACLGFAAPQTADKPPPQPSWVDQRLEAMPAGTPVLNDWGWGGYLMWRYPQLDLVMHGYGDTFTIAELERNKEILDLKPGWDAAVEDLGVRYAVLDPETPLAYALERLLGWSVVERSDEIELLQAPRDDSSGPTAVDNLPR